MAGERMNVAFAQKSKDGQKTYWKSIGSAWPRDDGGMSISLFAIPVPTDGEYRFMVFPDDSQRSGAGGERGGPAQSGGPQRGGYSRSSPKTSGRQLPPEGGGLDDEIPF